MNSRDKGKIVKVPIPSTNGLYLAGSDGSIWSVKRPTTKGGELKKYVSPHNGYEYVSISVNGCIKSKRVHRLIAEAFYGYEPGKQINHIDGNKTNNAADNLEYCTQSENMKHAFRLGLERVEGIHVIDLDTGKKYGSLTDAARDVGGSKGEMVNRVCKGKRSHYRNHRFAYLSDYLNGTIPQYSGKSRKKASVSLWR